MSSASGCPVGSTTLTEEESKKKEQVLVLRLKPKVYPHVTWGDDVVDNEHLGRLKSNCCCIYVPPRDFDNPETYEFDENEAVELA